MDTHMCSNNSGPPSGRGRKQHTKFKRHGTEFDHTRHKLGRFARRLVVSPRFEVAVSMVIIVNCVIMLCEEQLDGAMLGHELAFYSYYGSEDWAAGVPFDLFYYLEIVFAVIFTLEVILRMIGLEVFAYFGTFARSLLTLFELALANWAPVCRFLVENVHEAWLLFILVFKLVMGFAVIGVLNAVFMQETFKVAHTDDDIMVRQKARALSLHKRKMQELFEMADSDGNGRLNPNEFRAVIADPSIKIWLSSMDLDASDADLLFELLSGDDGLIDMDELINGITLVRGPARSLDMRYLMKVWQIDEKECIIQRQPRRAPSTPAPPAPA